MSTALHCYDYVNQPFEVVRRAVLADPRALVNAATRSTLHVEVGGIELGAEVELEVGEITESRESYLRPVTTIALSWRGRRSASWFPVMTAQLEIYPLSSTETQLELSGSYQAPLGKLGDAIDAIGLRRLAEHSVTTFVREIAKHLRAQLATAPAIS